MTTVFEGSPKFGSISGDQARVTAIEDRVLIRAIDAMDEEAVTIAMTPDQARALAAGIVAAAENAEAHPMTRDEALIRTALEMAAAEAEGCGTCAVCDDCFVASAAIRSIDPAEVLEKVGEVETTPAPDAIARLVEALEAMLHAVCGETGFAACVRHDSGLAYPWPALEAAEEKARSVLRALKGDE